MFHFSMEAFSSDAVAAVVEAAVGWCTVLLLVVIVAVLVQVLYF